MNYILERLGTSVTVDYFDFKWIQPRKIIVHDPISDINPWEYQFMSYASTNTQDSENKSLIIVIPTCDSDFYVLEHLSRVVKNICDDKINTFLSEFLIHILVVINGEISSNFKKQLMKFLSRHRYIKNIIYIAAIHAKNKSKVLAMNYGHQYAISNNINYIFFMDDDVILYPRTIPRLLLELVKGNYALVGGNPSLIELTCLTNQTENLFSKIVTLKRQLTGYSLPVGRLLGMRTKNYPIIPNYIIADDVFLNAFCVYHKLPQKIIANAYVGYLGSTSYFQWLSRSFRIEVSDQQILRLLPMPQRIQLQNLLHHIPFQSKPSQKQLLVLDFCRDIKVEGLRMLNNMKYSLDIWGADFSTKITSQNKLCIYDSYFNNSFSEMLLNSIKYLNKYS
ncbi:MAG: glycosyltransferase [Nostoc sp.]